MPETAKRLDRFILCRINLASAQCPKPPAMESKKTIYAGVGHNSWDMTYDGSAGHDPFAWMLGFKKP